MKKKVLSIMLAVALMLPTMPVMAAEVEDMPTSLVEEQEEVVEEAEVQDESTLVDNQLTAEEETPVQEVVEEEDAEVSDEVVADDFDATEEKIEEDAEVSEDEKEAIEGEVTEVPEVTEEEAVEEDLETTEEEVVEDPETTEEEVVEDLEATEEEVTEEVEVTEEETVVEDLEVIEEETVQEEPAELEIVAVEEDELLGETVKNGGSSQENATAMVFGEDYIGNFPNSNEQWYKFTTKSAPGYYKVYGKNLSLDAGLMMYVINTWGEKIKYNEYLTGEWSYIEKLEPNTTYYIKTTPKYNHTGNYRVRIDYIADSEGNDMNSSVPLTTNKVYRGTMAVDGDVDYYKFTTGKNGYYQIKIVDENVQYIDVRLQSRYGEKLESISIYIGNTGIINKILEGNTTYYLNLKAYSGAGNYTIEYKPLTDNEGDTDESALALSEGKIYETSLCIDKDLDYYKIVPKFSGRYNINLINRNINGWAYVYLYSEYGQELKNYYWWSGAEKDRYLQYSLEKGVTYYLCVRSGYSGNYAISYKKDFPFTDVTPLQEGHWQYEAVEYAYENGVMSGKNSTMFDPKANLTRAEFAQVLYNMEGKPWVDTWNNRYVFSDVEQDEWYTKAVIWAYKEGIVSGYPDGRYGVRDHITREQVAKMLYNYSEYKGENVSHRASISNFPDNWQVSNWAKPYVQWAVAMNMMSGKNVNGKLSLVPKGSANRAECASMISRYLQNS